MPRQSTFGTVLYVLAGPIIWAAHVTVIYGVQSTACAVRASPGLLVDVVIAAATILAVGLAGMAAARAGPLAAALGARELAPATQSFTRRVMVLLALLAIFGIVGAGAAAAFLPACGTLR